jgi:hypothetical protein
MMLRKKPNPNPSPPIICIPVYIPMYNPYDLKKARIASLNAALLTMKIPPSVERIKAACGF